MIAAGVIAAGAVGGYLARKPIARAWVPTSSEDLERTEAKMFEPLLATHQLHHHMIKCADGNVIHTLHVPYTPHPRESKAAAAASPAAASSASASSSSSSSAAPPSLAGELARARAAGRPPPLVLLHGLGGGLGLWSKNLVDFARHTDVIAIDLLGFGRSSRLPFTGDSERALAYWVDSVEQWRAAAGIDTTMQLLGHSLGGYVALGYALKHQAHVDRLILVAPFGVANTTALSGTDVTKGRSLGMRVTFKLMAASSPQTLVRVMGPWGPKVMRRFRGEYDNRRYRSMYGPGDFRASDYVYHLTAGASGAGDYAFMALMDEKQFVKLPLQDRLGELPERMAVTAIYGDEDGIVPHTGEVVADRVRGPVRVETIDGGGHHMYASHMHEFVEAVMRRPTRASTESAHVTAHDQAVHATSPSEVSAEEAVREF